MSRLSPSSVLAWVFAASIAAMIMWATAWPLAAGLTAHGPAVRAAMLITLAAFVLSTAGLVVVRARRAPRGE